MSQNYQNKSIAIWFDLHDTLVDSRRQWLKSFKQFAPQNYNKIKKDYLGGIRKESVCKKYNLDFIEVKKIYHSNLKPLKNVIKLYNYLKQKKLVIYLVTNAVYTRAMEDLTAVNCKFDKYYTRDIGVKPDEKYIKQILKENNLDCAIMIGNSKKNDIFSNPQVKTLLISRHIPFCLLKLKFNRILSSL